MSSRKSATTYPLATALSSVVPPKSAMASLLSLSLSSTPTQAKSIRRLLSTSFKGNAIAISHSLLPLKTSHTTSSLTVRAWVRRDQAALTVGDGLERLRLDNLRPQVGSRKKGKRKGRGTAAGQGNSCGFGMRGQKSRSGPGVRKGFEGGQMPLYRRIPKLRGIAGGTIILLSKISWRYLNHSR